MAAIARAIYRVTRAPVDTDSLGGILLFSVLGLIASFFAIEAYGLDLSAGFF